MPDWLAALLLLAAVLVGALLLHAVVMRAAARIVARTRSPVDDMVVQRGRRPSRLAAVAIAAILIVPGLPLGAWAAAEFERAAGLVLIFAIGWLIVSLSHVLTGWAALRYDLTSPDNALARQVHTRVQMLRRVIVAVAGVLTVCLMLMAFPTMRQIGLSLFASAGIAGLIVGMAARPALSNLIAGIQLALSAPMRIGDYVVIEGEGGTVEEITATYVIVRADDERRLVVPLANFIEKPFQNWSREGGAQGAVTLAVDPGVPVEAVRREALRLLEAAPLWDRRVARVEVVDVKPAGVEVRIVFSAADGRALAELRPQMREQLLGWLRGGARRAAE